MKHHRSKKHQEMAFKISQEEQIGIENLVEFEDEAEILEENAGISVESDEQAEYLKYEDEMEESFQTQHIDSLKLEEVPTMITETENIENSDYCDVMTMLEQLYENSYQNYDVALHGADGTIRAHRSVLSAGSDFFREAFKTSIHFEIESVINIHLPDYSIIVIQLLIKFLYSGQVLIPMESVQEFSDICHELNVNTMNYLEDKEKKQRLQESEIIENLSNSLNCKKISESPSENDDLDEDFLAYKIICKKKLKKKKTKNLEKKLDLALIDVLAGENITSAAKKYQIETNSLMAHVTRYKNIQEVCGSNLSNQIIPSTIYRIKRGEQDGGTQINCADLYEISNKPWDYHNSNRPTISGANQIIIDSVPDSVEENESK